MKPETPAAGCRTSQPPCSPFLAGCEAFRAGVKVGDNPHNEDTEDHWRWMAGWAEAGMKARRANAKAEGRS